MEKINIILEDGSTREVEGIFYLYNSKYYFIYTQKEIDDNGYVVLYVVQVGKEVNNTPNGPIDTGYMVGVDINNLNESELVQTSITRIVEDKKNNISSPEIQYLPINMLSNLKIVSKKTFRLLKSLVETYFGLTFESVETDSSNNVDTFTNAPSQNSIVDSSSTNVEDKVSPQEYNSNAIDAESNNNIRYQSNESSADNSEDVIIDYRARFFEEQEKNKELEQKIKELNDKLSAITQIIG